MYVLSALFCRLESLETYHHHKQIYKFGQSGLAELARNSVIQSGFEMEVKRHWIGQKWYLPGAAGNDINKVSLLQHSLFEVCLLNRPA
jgi:AMP deaminase